MRDYSGGRLFRAVDTLLESYLELIQTLTEQIESLGATIEDLAGSPAETQLLMTIPGVSYFTALTIYAKLGEIDRFDRPLGTRYIH